MKCALRTAAATCVLLGLAAAVSAGQVRLEIRDGRVTLDAKDATIREILAEWARVGQTKVVNAERVPGGPVTLELIGVPERKALDVVLRAVAGYVAAPRTVAQATGSQYDRIMLMPASRPAVVPTGPAPASTAAQPQFQRYPQPQAPNVVVDDQDEPLPSAQMPLPGQQPSGAPQPGMMTSPPANMPAMPPNNPYGVNPGGGAQPAPPPMAPGSASRPGVPTPAPTPTQPIK